MEGLQFVADGVGLVELVDSGNDQFASISRCHSVVGFLGFWALEHGLDILEMK